MRQDFLRHRNRGSTVVETEELCPTSTQIKGDILITNIGNIPPYKEIRIIFSFIQILDITLNNKLKFVLPLVLTPRYIPLEKTYNLLRDFIYKGNKNEEEFGSMAKAGKIKFIQNEKENRLQYYYNVDIKINSMAKIETIETKMKNNDKIIIKKINDNVYEVFLDHSELHIPNEDFVLEYEINEEILKKPVLLLELHPKYENDYCFYYSFNPTKLIDDDKILCENNTVNGDFKGNFIFLIGRSDTMNGKRINMAKQCLIYFFKSLQENGSKFNIICYGSKFYSIFKNNKLVNDVNINEALKLVMEFEGDMGGNEIEKALKYSKGFIDNKLLNRIFVMTDGAIWGVDNCLKLIRNVTSSNKYDCKFYSIGIGNGCSESLIRGIASNGEGEFELVKNDEDISDKIIYLLESSMYYCLDNFNCRLKKCDDKTLKKFDYSSKLNSNIEFYALLNNPELLNDNSIICSFSFNNKKFNVEKKLELNKSIISDSLHKLFLKTFIDSNTESNLNKELAIKYQILTKDTAFYCLFHENNLTDEKLSLKKFKEIHNTAPIDYTIDKDKKNKESHPALKSETLKIDNSYKKKMEEDKYKLTLICEEGRKNIENEFKKSEFQLKMETIKEHEKHREDMIKIKNKYEIEELEIENQYNKEMMKLNFEREREYERNLKMIDLQFLEMAKAYLDCNRPEKLMEKESLCKTKGLIEKEMLAPSDILVMLKKELELNKSHSQPQNINYNKSIFQPQQFYTPPQNEQILYFNNPFDNQSPIFPSLCIPNGKVGNNYNSMNMEMYNKNMNNNPMCMNNMQTGTNNTQIGMNNMQMGMNNMQMGMNNNPMFMNNMNMQMGMNNMQMGMNNNPMCMYNMNMRMNNNPMCMNNMNVGMNNMHRGMNNMPIVMNSMNIQMNNMNMRTNNTNQSFLLSPDYIHIKILFNDIYFYTYKINGRDKASNEKVNEMIKNVLSQLKISDNIEEYEFYHEKKLFDILKLNDTVYKIFGTEGTFNIHAKNKYNLSKEDNIILKQKMNGLWEVDSYILSLLELNYEKWELSLDCKKSKIKNIINKDVDEETVFSIIVLKHIKKVLKGKNRVKLIFSKCIKGLNMKYNEINEVTLKMIDDE